MTKDAFIKQVSSLSEADFAKVSPFLEADLEAMNALDDLRNEIAAAREDAAKGPLFSADEAYERVRRKLSS
ncbi:MAG: hypothetical protein AAF911_10680 [Planctomycetota bacterium]